MKIAYIVPGSGGKFYCGNCLRDSSFIKTMSQTGNDTVVVPMYLPLYLNNGSAKVDSPIFYGAVNLYLKELNPLFKKMPHWLVKLLDSDTLLKFAANRSGSTNAVGLEQITISMLKGENGNQSDELNNLIDWFKKNGVPDVIHFSNALLLGLAPKIKKELGCSVICTLQDEDEWIEEMQEPYKSEAWNLILDNSQFVDDFIAVSHYFKQYILSKISIPENKINVIYNGIDLTLYEPKQKIIKENTIGFMSKINHVFGADILLDAFILLYKSNSLNNLKLKITGGYTKEDKKFIQNLNKKIKKEKIEKYVQFLEEFTDKARHNFFDSIKIFSVPAIRKEAFGLQLIESIASGVPVIQPNSGAYSEIVNSTDAGLIYEPNTPEKLAESLYKVLSDEKLYSNLKDNCFVGSNEFFNNKKQVLKIVDVYNKTKN